MSQTRVQREHVYPGGVKTFTSNVTAGNAIIILAATGANAGSLADFATPTDDKGNSYVQIDDVTVLQSAGSVRGRIAAWIAVNVAAGSTTVTVVDPAGDLGITLFEVSGVDNTTPVASHGNANGSSSPQNVSLSLSGNGSLWCLWGNTFTDVLTSFNGVTQRGHDSSHYDADGNTDSTAAGSYTVGVNHSGIFGQLVIAFALNDAAAGSPPALSISVSDAVTLSESRSLLLTDLVSVSDSVTVAESVTVQIGAATLSISVSDSVAITESATSRLLAFISVSDSVAVSEAITSRCDLNPVAVDLCTLSEAVTTRTDINPSVSDAVSLAESVTVRSDLNPAIYDSCTVSEVATVRCDLNRSVFDAVTVSDSLAVQIVDLVAVADSVAVGEFVVVRFDLAVSLVDSVIVADAVTAAVSGTVASSLKSRVEAVGFGAGVEAVGSRRLTQR